MQACRGCNEILRCKALGEFFKDWGEQSDDLGATIGRDPVRGKKDDLSLCRLFFENFDRYVRHLPQRFAIGAG